jgi:hypothetical protein
MKLAKIIALSGSVKQGMKSRRIFANSSASNLPEFSWILGTQDGMASCHHPSSTWTEFGYPSITERIFVFFQRFCCET